MFDPNFPFNANMSVYVDANRFDNYDTYTNLGDAPTGLQAVIDRLIFVTSSSTYYRWNGSAYVIAINPASGTVLSVTAGSASIVIAGTAQNPTVNTAQNIQTTATPTFSQVTSSTATPSAIGHLTRKDYVDGLNATSVKTASNVGTGQGTYKQLTGQNLEFRSITATSNKVALANNANDIGIDVTEANLTLDNVGGTLSANKGGSGFATYAVGDLLSADTTTTLFKINDVATGNALISGGVGTLPSYGKIGLTTHISGILAPANGGTNTSTVFTAGSVIFAGASGTYTEDNANLFWDNSTKRLAIGSLNPLANLEVSLPTQGASFLLGDRVGLGGTFRVVATGSKCYIQSGTGLGDGSAADLLLMNMYGGTDINWITCRYTGQVVINGTSATSSAKLEVKGSMAMAGSTSGAITFAVPAISGTNTITFPAGTTDFSTTGGTSQVVKQTSAGGAFTVGQVSTSELTGTLGVTNGGSGTSTQFTPGSVIFAGTSGVYTQDNAKLFFDDSNNRLGVGTASPSNLLDVDTAGGNAMSIRSTSTGGALRMTQSGGFNYIQSGSSLTGGTVTNLYFTSMNASNIWMQITSTGNIGLGGGSVTTTATNGFPYIPTCAGTPTGVPTTVTGMTPMVWDTTNKILYFYDSGWKKVFGGVTSSITYLTDVDNTDPKNPILNPKIGSKTPLFYTAQSPLSNGSQISFNAGSMATTTQIGIGIQPVNRSSHASEYIAHYLDYVVKCLPSFYLRLVSTTDATKYASFTLSALAGIGANDYGFTVTYISGESAGSLSVANGTTYHVIIEPLGQNTTASNVGSGQGVYKQKVAGDLQLRSITATSSKIALANNTNDIGLDVTESALVLYNTSNRNLISEASFQTYSFTSQVNPTVYTASGTGSLDVEFSAASDWIVACTLLGRHNHRLLSHHTTKKICTFAIQLIGTDWDLDSLDKLWMGFATKKTYQNIETWGTSNYQIGHDGVYDTSSENRQMWGRFSTTVFDRTTAGGGFTTGSRSGYTTNATPTPNDVLVCYFDTSYVFTLEWRDSTSAYAVKSTGTIASLDGATMRSNFHANDIVPTWSQHQRGATYGIRILSERDMTALGITVANSFNYFY